MIGAILKATNSSFQEGMPYCRIIYVKKVMKLLAFIFEQPSYTSSYSERTTDCVSYLPHDDCLINTLKKKDTEL